MLNNLVLQSEALPHMNALRSYALKLCRDEESSYDLVQETMLKAFCYSHTYAEGTNCKAWLFQICKNSYINSYRRAKYEPVAADFQQMEAHTDREAYGGQFYNNGKILQDESMAFSESGLFGDDVMLALTALPGDYQTAIILSDIEGYSYEEIANFIQVPIGTIRSRIHRGRKMLAAHLGHLASKPERKMTEAQFTKRTLS